MINSEGTQANNGLTPGKQLLQGRLQLGLTQEQVAKELYITLVKIKALESDDYKRLNSDTFTRGYIRAYANLLKLDVVAVLAAYDQLTPENEIESTSVTEVKKEASAPTGSFNGVLQYVLIAGAFLLGLWLMSVWFFDDHSEKNHMATASVGASLSSSSEDFSSSSVEASSVVSDASTADLMKTQSLERASASVTKTAVSSAGVSKSRASVSSRASATNNALANSARNESSSSVVVSSSVVNSSIAASSPADAIVASMKKSTTLDTISFTFRAECWLEVSDSRGDVLATELQIAGSKLTLVGKAPFDVKLGNAPGVDIQLNNKKIDVIPLLGSNVLTLRVAN